MKKYNVHYTLMHRNGRAYQKYILVNASSKQDAQKKAREALNKTVVMRGNDYYFGKTELSDGFYI